MCICNVYIVMHAWFKYGMYVDLVVSQLGQDWCTKYAMKFEAILAANKALCNRTDG